MRCQQKFAGIPDRDSSACAHGGEMKKPPAIGISPRDHITRGRIWRAVAAFACGVILAADCGARLIADAGALRWFPIAVPG